MKHFIAVLARGFFKIVFRILPLKNNKVIFNNFNGRGYGCNPKYIAEELISRSSGYDFVWIADSCEKSLPSCFRTVSYGGIKQLYETATAKVIITNVKNDLFFIKRKNQFMIQTWHGSYSSKKVEGQALDKLPKEYLKESRKNSKQCDIFISNSKALSKYYRDAFWCECEIFECGFPRNDIFFKDITPIKKQVKKKLSLSDDTKLVLYAPTFRDDGSTDCYSLDVMRVIGALSKGGEDWRLIIRLHPNVAESADIFAYTDKIINGSVYPDMQELLIASDILITDYSSTVFDFAVMRKPSYIFAPDYEEYSELRGLSDDFLKMPYRVCRTNDEIIDELSDYSEGVGQHAAEQFMEFYGGVDNGNAAKLVVDRIIEFIS